MDSEEHNNGDRDSMYTADNICKIIEFLIDNIFFGQFVECLFHQMIEIPMGTNCASLLADLFLYSFENEFLYKYREIRYNIG